MVQQLDTLAPAKRGEFSIHGLPISVAFYGGTEVEYLRCVGPLTAERLPRPFRRPARDLQAREFSMVSPDLKGVVPMS